MSEEELININGIREDLYQAMQIGDITLNSKHSQDLYDFMNYRDKEIERLNNIIEEYKNANEYHQNIIHELETMKQPNQLYSENVKLRSENKRLNNIINELEKYCIEEIEDYSKEIKSQYITDNTRVQYEGEKVCFEDILDRLQELKGSDKN